MSKITDLISPKQEITFKGETFMLESGFTLEESAVVSMAFGQSNSEETKYNGLKGILKVIAKRIYPTATDAQISKIDVKHSGDLLEVFYQLDDTTSDKMEEIKQTLEKAGQA